MNEPSLGQEDNQLTLDPPGRIAVVGAGPLGIEAALYGRFLGYDIALVEAVEVGHAVREATAGDQRILAARYLSSLAISAIQAQNPDSAGLTQPMTVPQWIDQTLVPLTETDLLHGRLHVPRRVTRILTVPVEGDDEDEDVSFIPPDFRLTLVGPEGQIETLDSEAVILALGNTLEIELDFPLPAPYLFRIGADSANDWENSLLAGRREIVTIYAQLAGRETLDLYRPRRV